MPELPEVQTTVNGLNKYLIGLTITDIWSSYDSSFHKGKGNIKDRKYFNWFKKEIKGKKILKARRIGKNILIDLTGDLTILVHMKMTGHLLYGKYKKQKNVWSAEEKGPLQDSFNRFVRLIFTLSNGNHLALSDMRKFAKVCLSKTKESGSIEGLDTLGPDIIKDKINLNEFKKRLNRKPKGKIKTVLMDQTILSGIGNIYSDEALWDSNIHPLNTISSLNDNQIKKLFSSAKKVLKAGINLGGDSMSDYRNIEGEKGRFQLKHNAYRKTGMPCSRVRCSGKIEKMVVGGRSTHYCPIHQKKNMPIVQ